MAPTRRQRQRNKRLDRQRGAAVQGSHNTFQSPIDFQQSPLSSNTTARALCRRLGVFRIFRASFALSVELAIPTIFHIHPHVLLAIIRTINVSKIDYIIPKSFQLDMVIKICQPYLDKLVWPFDLGRLPKNLEVLYLVLKAEINQIVAAALAGDGLSWKGMVQIPPGPSWSAVPGDRQPEQDTALRILRMVSEADDIENGCIAENRGNGEQVEDTDDTVNSAMVHNASDSQPGPAAIVKKKDELERGDEHDYKRKTYKHVVIKEEELEDGD